MTDNSHGLPLTEGPGSAPQCGVDEADIRRLVISFYDAARDDSLIGPIFDKVENWDMHYDTLCEFWSSAVLKTGRYSGRPAEAHFGLKLNESHFDRWMTLWERTAVEALGKSKSAPFVDMGRRMVRAMMNVTGMLH